MEMQVNLKLSDGDMGPAPMKIIDVNPAIVGQVWRDYESGGLYMMSHVGGGRLALISLENGNLYTDPVWPMTRVQITLSEWTEICGGARFIFVAHHIRSVEVEDENSKNQQVLKVRDDE